DAVPLFYVLAWEGSVGFVVWGIVVVVLFINACGNNVAELGLNVFGLILRVQACFRYRSRDAGNREGDYRLAVFDRDFRILTSSRRSLGRALWTAPQADQPLVEGSAVG